MYRQILVPLDGSRFAESALPIALAVSRRTNAPVHFLTVQEPIPSFAYDEWESAAQEWSEEYLGKVVERVGDRAGGAITTSLRSGHVVEGIEAEVEERGADLIIMASHGRGMLSRAWLGSVTDAFIHHTDRPVLVVRPDDDVDVDLATDHVFKDLLLPLDGSDLSEQALADAVEFGTLFEASYHLVRVVPYPIDVASPYLPHTVQMNQGIVDEAKESAAEYLEAHAERLRARGLKVTTAVLVDAQPGHGVLKEADAQGCDFIVMATHGRSGLSRAILGSASDKVLRGTHVPLLLHRPGS